MTDVRFLQSAVRKTTPGPGTAPPGRPLFAPGSGPRCGTIIRESPTSRASRVLLARPGALRRGAAGQRQGLLDSVGQQATLTSCQPGSDTLVLLHKSYLICP
jgi:hypothetical protein